MVASLFDDTTLAPTRQALINRLVEGYARELLKNPPVRSVSACDPDREENARRLARRDVMRTLDAAQHNGLTLEIGLRSPEAEEGAGDA